MTNSYYEILGVNTSASSREIKKAYRTLVQRYHPDKNKGNKTYEEKLKKINEAYEILIDKQKRIEYDGQFIQPEAPVDSRRDTKGSGRQYEENSTDKKSKSSQQPKSVSHNIWFKQHPIISFYLVIIIAGVTANCVKPVSSTQQVANNYQTHAPEQQVFTPQQPVNPQQQTIPVSSTSISSNNSTFVPDQPLCPDNSQVINGQCQCNNGYQWSSDNTKCVQIAYIQITYPDSIGFSQFGSEPIYIEGRTSNDCSKITVNASSDDGTVHDNYQLQKYKYGQNSFRYSVGKAFNNLTNGFNYYMFTASCDDDQIKQQDVTIYFSNNQSPNNYY
jgi:hypothetical protein